MNDISVISDFDVFFFYGDNELSIENESDLTAGLTQPKRSMFYDRRDAAGIQENYANSFSMAIMVRYGVSNWVAWRNSVVSDGSASGSRDRRVAVSQDRISFFRDDKGNLDVEVLYIPFADFRKGQQLTIPIPGGV